MALTEHLSYRPGSHLWKEIVGEDLTRTVLCVLNELLCNGGMLAPAFTASGKPIIFFSHLWRVTPNYHDEFIISSRPDWPISDGSFDDNVFRHFSDSLLPTISLQSVLVFSFADY
jgi:hypothetical protein